MLMLTPLEYTLFMDNTWPSVLGDSIIKRG
jgi:hypothetical protein